GDRGAGVLPPQAGHGPPAVRARGHDDRGGVDAAARRRRPARRPVRARGNVGAVSVSERALVEEQYSTTSNLRARIALHERFSTSSLSYPRWTFDGYAFADRADVLEVGCGDAMIWRENADRITAGWRLTLTDLSSGMVEAARAALGDRARYAVADVVEL